MRNVRFPLSWKLTLCSILMMLLMWTAVGAVLVMSTAEEIMEAQDDEAQRRADMVMQYGGVDTIGYYYRLDQGDHWIEEAGQRRSEVLFPEENSSWPSRYSQYTVIRPISADYDSRTVWAETLIGIQVQSAPEGEPWNDQYLIFLENYSPDDLYAISELVNRGGGAAPIRAVGHADLRHRFFWADTITIGDTSFTNHRTGGQDAYFLGESGEPLEENSYFFSPRFLDRTRTEMMNAVRCHVHGLTTAQPLHERKSSILKSYSSGFASQYNEEEPDLSFSVEVFFAEERSAGASGRPAPPSGPGAGTGPAVCLGHPKNRGVPPGKDQGGLRPGGTAGLPGAGGRRPPPGRDRRSEPGPAADGCGAASPLG